MQNNELYICIFEFDPYPNSNLPFSFCPFIDIFRQLINIKKKLRKRENEERSKKVQRPPQNFINVFLIIYMMMMI